MLRKLQACLISLIVVAFGTSEGVWAAMIGMPLNLRNQVEHLRFEGPVLPPMAHVKYCLKYPSDCKAGEISSPGDAFALTAERYADLARVNADVNRSIVPTRNERGIVGEEWIVAPSHGDCNDYAVTKQHMLLEHGWPIRALLLAEVVTNSGEHHLILVVRTSSGDLVVDNLNADIRPWPKPNYRWVRMQSPDNPRFWAKVAAPTSV